MDNPCDGGEDDRVRNLEEVVPYSDDVVVAEADDEYKRDFLVVVGEEVVHVGLSASYDGDDVVVEVFQQLEIG